MTKASEIEILAHDLLDKQDGAPVDESGSVSCAANFMNGALESLKAGDYETFLCRLDLAGDFARDARAEYYKRDRK
jgi:hypothetical protein